MPLWLSREQSEKRGGTRGFFSDQFENLANYRAHYLHTGPEIWDQACGRVDAFVCAAGMGAFSVCR